MKIVLYLSLFALLSTYTCVQVYDGDIGHHLKAGEWMLAYGKVLDRDIFSYTAAGRSWLNHSWLAEIILYYIYSLGGINGLVYFKIIILILSYVILIKTCHIVMDDKSGLESDLIVAILFIMSVTSASARFIVRPLIFTFLLVALSIYFYARARKHINFLFFIPLTLLFWVNLHAEFMMGVIMVALFWLHRTGIFVTNKIFKKKESLAPSHYSTACIVLILSAGALFATPYGIKLFTHPLNLTSSDLFMTRISEWLPPMHPIFREESFIKVFYWFLGIGLLSFLMNFKKKDTLFFLFFITFGLMSLSAIRFMPYLTMIGVPVVAENLPLHLIRCGGVLKRLALISIIIFSIFLMERRTRYTEFGVGLAERICYPLGAGNFLDRAGIKGNVFNMCDFGGYLIWFHPERPVFVDGRLDVYGEKIYEDFLSPDEEVFKKYNIDYIFLSFRHPATRELLYENENWPLIYWDDTALIYLKKTEKNMGLIEKYAYQYIHPLTGSYNFLENAPPELKANVWKEMHRAIRLSPESIRAHVVLGDIYVELKDYKKAVQAYEEAIGLGEKYHTEYMIKVHHNLGKLYHNLSQYSKAEKYYRKVLKMARSGESIYNKALEDWGQLAYVQGKKNTAFRLIKRAVSLKKKSSDYILSDYPVTLAKLALIYEGLGKKDHAMITWEEVYKIGSGDTRQQAYEHLSKLNE